MTIPESNDDIIRKEVRDLRIIAKRTFREAIIFEMFGFGAVSMHARELNSWFLRRAERIEKTNEIHPIVKQYSREHNSVFDEDDLCKLDREEMSRAYQRGISASVICRYYNLSPSTLKRVLKSENIKWREKKERSRNLRRVNAKLKAYIRKVQKSELRFPSMI